MIKNWNHGRTEGKDQKIGSRFWIEIRICLREFLIIFWPDYSIFYPWKVVISKILCKLITSYCFLLKIVVKNCVKTVKNSKKWLRCYGDCHGCYGPDKNSKPVVSKSYNPSRPKTVYRTQIGWKWPELWAFTFLS